MATTGKKGGSTIFWIIGSLVVLGGGIGAYFLLRKPKDEEKDKPKDVEVKLNQGGGDGGGGGGGTNTRPSELNTKAKITEFQNYVINTKKDNRILGRSGADGLYGKNTIKAWNKYGTDFKASTGTSTNVSTTVDAQLQVKINGIRALADKNSAKVKSSYVPTLQKSPIFVDTWYKALLGKTETFSTQGKVFRTNTGESILNFIPKDNVFGLNKEVLLRQTPTSATGEKLPANGTSLGKGGEVKLSGGKVFIYFSNIARQGNPKRKKGWIQNQSALKIGQKSQFSGIIEEMEFINFDNHFDLNF